MALVKVSVATKFLLIIHKVFLVNENFFDKS